MNFKFFTIILLCIGVTLFAQDSVEVNFLLSGQIYESPINANNVTALPATLTELKLSRNWKRDLKSLNSINHNEANLIKFKKKKDNFIDSDLFLVVVGAAVTFGATAAYFKLESDAAYDKYLDTSQKKYKDKTDRYDLYSGISLGLMELNVGYLIYKFLTD